MAKQINTLIAAAALWALALAPAALAQGVGQDVIGEPKVPQTHSVEQADAKLAEVARTRAALDAEYAASEEVCYTRFFVNHCLDQAKEKRRLAMSGLRAVEVEASYFKRRHAVEQRDAELAERMKKDTEEEARRALTPDAPREAREAPVPPGKPGPSVEQRQAEHDARLRREAAQDAAAAGQRAANVAAFERKKAESEKRQAQVAAKKAEKEAKAKKQAEAAAAAAAKKAAAPPPKN